MTIAQISAGPLPPPARPASSEPSPSGEGDFAQLMALQAPAEPAGDAAAPARADETRQAKARQAGRAFARGTQAEARRDSSELRKPGPESGEANGSDAAEGAGEATDPALAQWLAQWHRPPAEAAATAVAEPGDAKRATPDATGVESIASAERPGARPAPDTVPLADGRTTPNHPVARAGERAARERTPAIDAATAAARDEAAALTAPAREPAPATPVIGLALPAGFEPAPATSSTAAPMALDAGVVGVPLPVPLESPEFAAAFGVEISLLAKDGVQQAELHLNPAEMGPVSVQIALDGEKARIDFGAQAAATRAAIEASLPELAAALRDAGLTLAGGGVTQHAGQGGGQRGEARRDGESGPAARIEGAGRGDAQAAAPARPTWRGRAGASGVDLYA